MVVTVKDQAWIDLALVKESIGISTGSTGDDNILNQYINSVTDFIQHQLGDRQLLIPPADVTEVYDGGDGFQTRLSLKDFPQEFDNITSFQYRSGTISNPSWIDFGDDTFAVYPDTGIIKVFTGLLRGSRNIRVISSAGYRKGTGTGATDSTGYGSTGSTIQIPDDLVQLAINMVSKVWNRRESAGIKQEKTDVLSITWSDEVSEFDQVTLDSYKKIVF
ncbi:MAG: hypothetical protein KAS32_21210 [Candidatus Peribacteraceae bacterium]|nr:hypothetical protein [Candidatus Peribacteraceae bacterium]